jgi:hypothetical protein
MMRDKIQEGPSCSEKYELIQEKNPSYFNRNPKNQVLHEINSDDGAKWGWPRIPA